MQLVEFMAQLREIAPELATPGTELFLKAQVLRVQAEFICPESLELFRVLKRVIPEIVSREILAYLVTQSSRLKDYVKSLQMLEKISDPIMRKALYLHILIVQKDTRNGAELMVLLAEIFKFLSEVSEEALVLAGDQFSPVIHPEAPLDSEKLTAFSSILKSLKPNHSESVNAHYCELVSDYPKQTATTYETMLTTLALIPATDKPYLSSTDVLLLMKYSKKETDGLRESLTLLETNISAVMRDELCRDIALFYLLQSEIQNQVAANEWVAISKSYPHLMTGKNLTLLLLCYPFQKDVAALVTDMQNKYPFLLTDEFYSTIVRERGYAYNLCAALQYLSKTAPLPIYTFLTNDKPGLSKEKLIEIFPLLLRDLPNAISFGIHVGIQNDKQSTEITYKESKNIFNDQCRPQLAPPVYSGPGQRLTLYNAFDAMLKKSPLTETAAVVKEETATPAPK